MAVHRPTPYSLWYGTVRLVGGTPRQTLITMKSSPDSNRTKILSARIAPVTPLNRRRMPSVARFGFELVLLVLLLGGLGACTGDSASLDDAGGDGASEVDTTSGSDSDNDNASEVDQGDESPPLAAAVPEPAQIDVGGIWVDPARLRSLPMSGPGWEAIRQAADGKWDKPKLNNGDNDHDVQVLAGALYAARTGDNDMLEKVESELAEVTGKRAKDILPLARNLLSYVVAADLIDYRPPEFTSWLREVLDAEADGRAGIVSLRESAMSDPSNHGTHARASVLAVALFTDDEELADTVADRFHDWLGRSSEGFLWKELDWQSDPASPVGINPVGSRIDNLQVDGVLPEEQRRSGGFEVPPPREGYVWEALQGAVATAEMLDRAGYPAWEWEDRALQRAFVWLYDVNDYPAEGDDTWQVWLVNRAYDTDFETTSPTRPGKNLGYTDWTHQS